MTQRIKGQNLRVSVTGPAGVEEGLVDVQSFEAELQLEIQTENYLGETTSRKDDIFNGVRGRMEIHLETALWFDFVDRVKARSQRRTPADEVFNCVTSVEFEDGTRRIISIEDIFFGPLPLRAGSRAEYVTATIDFESSDVRFIN